MSLENMPEKGLRPTTDVMTKCCNDHPILVRFPMILPVGVFSSTYPWDYSSGIVNGTVNVPIISLKEGKRETYYFKCPNCPENSPLSPTTESLTEIDIQALWEVVKNARTKR